jgi:transcriptional regulator with XRE-family HTH domain
MYDVIARGVAEARHRKGWTQEQTAKMFRAHGLRAWRKGTVGQLEAGLRKPRLDELLVIARALGTSVDKLFPGRDGERVELGDDAQVSPRWIREMLTGEFFTNLDRPAEEMPYERFPLDDVMAEIMRLARAEEKRNAYAMEAIGRWAEQHDVKLMGADLFAAHERASDAERHAAQRLGVRIAPLKLASRALWNHKSFDQERDYRVGNADELPPRSRQARRGLVTREMFTELRILFQEIGVLPGRGSDGKPPENGDGEPEGPH